MFNTALQTCTQVHACMSMTYICTMGHILASDYIEYVTVNVFLYLLVIESGNASSVCHFLACPYLLAKL